MTTFTLTISNKDLNRIVFRQTFSNVKALTKAGDVELAKHSLNAPSQTTWYVISKSGRGISFPYIQISKDDRAPPIPEPVKSSQVDTLTTVELPKVTLTPMSTGQIMLTPEHSSASVLNPVKTLPNRFSFEDLATTVSDMETTLQNYDRYKGSMIEFFRLQRKMAKMIRVATSHYSNFLGEYHNCPTKIPEVDLLIERTKSHGMPMIDDSTNFIWSFANVSVKLPRGIQDAPGLFLEWLDIERWEPVRDLTIRTARHLSIKKSHLHAVYEEWCRIKTMPIRDDPVFNFDNMLQTIEGDEYVLAKGVFQDSV
jgi:hypothetical protein